MQCRAHVAQLGRLYPEFKKAGAEVLVILGARREQAAVYAELVNAPFPILADPDRAVYRLFGLEKAYLFIRRTASVVVDRDGVIQYMERATNPMKWLEESEEVLWVVESL